MRKLTLILSFIAILSSCSNEHYDFTSNMFTQLEQADSLYKLGQTEEAIEIQNRILGLEIPQYIPSSYEKFSWRVSETTYESYTAGLFALLAKIYALDALVSETEIQAQRIEILRNIFTQFNELHDLAEQYIEYEKLTSDKNNTFDYNKLRNRYETYIKKVEPAIVCSSIRSDFIACLYRLKWNIINQFIIESDSLYGYDTTFTYLDHVFEYNGHFIEGYTKLLARAYMSFSGIVKYQYDSGMNYQQFKKLTSNNEKWTVKYIKRGSPQFSFASGAPIMNSQNEGFIFQYDDQHIYSPELNIINPNDRKKHQITTVNDKQISMIELQEGQIYSITQVSNRTIDKSLLCALMYKHNKPDVVSKLMAAKQYYVQDTLIRVGREDDHFKKVKYLNNIEIESSLYSIKGNPITDEFGVHMEKIYHSTDTCILSYFGTNKKLREGSDAIVKIITLPDATEEYYFYDSNCNLTESWSGDDIKRYYRVISSRKTIIENDYKNNFSSVTIFLIDENKHYPDTILSKEVKFFNGLHNVAAGIQNGNLIEVHRHQADGAFYTGTDLWAYEVYNYNVAGRVSEKIYYDHNQVFQGRDTFSYTKKGVCKESYDKYNVKIIDR